MVKQNNNIFHDLGKIPPQAIDLEEAVIGAILVEQGVFNDVSEYLKAESFYKEAHQIIFRAIEILNDERKTIDLLTVVEQLRKINRLEEIGGPIVIAQLSSKVNSASHVIEHAKIVAEKYIKRELIRISIELNNSMYDDEIDLLSAINDFDNQKMSVLSFTKDEEKHIKEAIDETIEHSRKINQNLIPKGIPTGITYYDEFSGGMQRGDLMVIGGEPSHGKTTLALDMLENSTKLGTKGGIFSYEMTTFQLSARLIGRSQKISSKDIIRGNINPYELKSIETKCSRLKNSELYIVKPSGSSFVKLKKDIVRMVKLYGLELIVIDYLQLLSNPKHGASKADMVADMANELKSLAVELNVAIILLSQLAREKGSPRPTITRLKYSGDIEAAADVILLTYLPFKYNFECESVNGESVFINENGIIIIGKGRNIGISEFVLEFKKEIPAFFNYNSGGSFMEPTDFTQSNNVCPFE